MTTANNLMLYSCYQYCILPHENTVGHLTPLHTAHLYSDCTKLFSHQSIIFIPA